MNQQLVKCLFGCSAISVIVTLLFAVPVIGIFPALLAQPLFQIWPELGETNEFIEYGFAWVTVKQGWVWLVFFLYYFMITFVPLVTLDLLCRAFERSIRGKGDKTNG